MKLKQDAIRREPNEIDCEAFMELHTDYLDGFLPVEQVRVFDAHAASCPSCARFDRVVRRGLLLVRNTGEIEPSADFHDRLTERLRAPEPPRPAVLNWNVALVVGAVLLVASIPPLVRYSGLLQLENEVAPEAKAPTDAAPADPWPPLQATDAWWQTPGAVPIGTPAGPFGVVSSPPAGDFSPLLIQAPLIEPAPAAPRLVTYPVPLDPIR